MHDVCMCVGILCVVLSTRHRRQRALMMVVVGVSGAANACANLYIFIGIYNRNLCGENSTSRPPPPPSGRQAGRQAGRKSIMHGRRMRIIVIALSHTTQPSGLFLVFA